MPIDYNQRFDELLKDNPYAAEYGVGPEPAKPPSFAHLTEPLPPPRPDPTRPSEAGRPSFLHLTEPLPGEEDTNPAEDYVDTPTYHGPINQSTLGAGVNTATRAGTRNALNVVGGTMQGLARDPLGPIGWIPGLRGLADIAQPEQPIGWLEGAGQWAKDTAASPDLAAPPGWAGGWTDTIAGAVGSTIPFAVTAAIPGGAAVSISSGAILGSYAALDEQVQEAIRHGATPEQIKKASRMASIGGLTEPVPLEIIFNRIPLPGLAKGAVQIAGRLLAKAAAEGGQEAVQTAIQNFSENYVYNPDQDLTEGLAQAFGIGAIVGGGFAVGAEAGGAGASAPAPGVGAVPSGGAPAGPPVVTPPAPGVTTPAGTPPLPAPGGAPGVTTPAAGVTIPASPVMTAPAPVVGGDEDALPDLLPMPEEEEPVAPEPVVAPAAELPATPEQPLLPPEAPAAAPAAEQVELPFAGQPGAPTGPQVGGRPAAPSAKLPAAPRTPSQVQQATGVPYAEAARIAESEGWRAPTAPEAPAAAPAGFSHLTEPIGTRRTPAPPQYAGDRVNIKASDAQRQARNAEIGHYRWQPGVNVGIEVPAAGTRRAMALPGVPQWEAQLPPGVAYGRIKGTRTRKPEIKTFIGSTPNDQVFLIDQIDPTTGKFDEPKVLLDFQSMEEARNAYISSYSDGRGAERIGSISTVPVADFRTWLKSPRTQRPFDRKATAASRRLRQAYTAEAKSAPTVAAGLQGTLDAVPTIGNGGANLLGNLAESHPGLEQGYGSLDVPTQRVVKSAVVNAFQDDEVFRRVVPTIPIDVMNRLAGKKRSAQDLFQNKAMFIDALSRNLNRSVTAGIVDAAVRNATGRGAEDSLSADIGGPALDQGAAPSTGEAGAERPLPSVAAGVTAEPLPSVPSGKERVTTDLTRSHEPSITDGGSDSQRIRSDQGPHEEGHAAEGGKKPRGGRVQSAPSGQPSDRAPQREEEQPAQQEGLGRQAQEHVLEEGRAKGVEFLWAIDANGNVIADEVGEKTRVEFPKSLTVALLDPKNSIVLHHNHPDSSSLSVSDVANLGYKGMHAIWAHGHDGRIYRGSLTKALRKKLADLWPERRKMRIAQSYMVVEKRLVDALLERQGRGLVSLLDLTRGGAINHLVNITLHNGNVIDYDSNVDATAFIARAEIGELLDELVTSVGKSFDVSPRTTGRYSHRPTVTLRHKGEVGATFERIAGRPAQRHEEPADQGRPADHRKEEERQAPVPAVEPTPAPDLAARWDELPLEQKEALLKAAKVARSPITRWKDFGEANQQKLQAAEPEPEVLEELSYPRRPRRAPDPGATFVRPEERRVLSKTMGKLGKEGVNLSLWNRRIADQYEAAQRLGTSLANTGAAIPEVLNIRNAMSAYSGRTSALGFHTEQQYSKPIMKALNRIQKAIGRSGTTFEDFNKYLIAMHAPERNAYLRNRGSTIADPSGMSDADAAAIVAAAHPEFATIAPEVYKLLRETVDLQLKSGLIDQETYDLITQRYNFYVPLQGWADAEGDETVATGQGFDVRGREFHAATGRMSMADAPLAYALQGANRAITRAEKNRVLQVLNRLVQRFPNSEFWQRDRAVKERYWHEDPTTGVREIRERWVPPQTLANSKEGLKNTIVVKEKGVPHYITIYDQPMLEAVRSLGAEEMNGLLRTMGTVLRGIGKLYTTYNPIFIIRNFFRDLQTALLTMQEENLKGLGWSVFKRLRKSGGGMHRYLRGKPKPAREADDPALWHAHEYARAGGMVGWMEQHSIEKQKDRLQRAIDGKNFSNKVGAAFEVIENANGAVENAVRLSLYMELVDRKYSKQRAALAAKEVTTNFNRKGQWGQVINSLYIFFNARVQGAARIGRVLRNPRANKVKIAALGVLPAMGFLTSLVNRIIGGEDDDGLNAWDSVPQYEKEKNFIVMNPWGAGYLKIPMSYGYNAFYVVGQQTEAAMANMLGYGDGVEPQTAGWNVWHAITNATSPVDLMRAGWSGFVPTLAAPFTEMAENLNYQGAPLYPTKYNPKDPDAELYFRGVNPFWKGVARQLEHFSKYDRRKPAAIDVSPESMEHLFNTYFGGLGQLGSQSFNLGLNAGRLAMGYPIDMELPRDIPVVREVLGTENNPFTRQNRYYEVWDNIDSLTADIKDKELTAKEAKAEYPLEYALKGEFEAAQKRLREQRERRKKIDNNPRLSSVERQRRLDAVEDKMDDIRAGALQDYAEELKRQRTGATLH